MRWFHLFIVWIHLLAATFWVGGMLFLSVVAVPLLRTHPDSSGVQRWFVNVARRFRVFVWGGVVILLFTGIILLPIHVSHTIPLNWPPIVLTKLVMVAMLIGISITHEFIVAPRVRIIKQKVPSSWSSSEQVLVKVSPWIARLALVLGLAVYLVAAVLARN